MTINPMVFKRLQQPPQQNIIRPEISPQIDELNNRMLAALTTGPSSPEPTAAMPSLGLSPYAGGIDIGSLSNQRSNLAAILQNQPKFADILQSNYLPQDEVARLQELQKLRDMQESSQLQTDIKDKSSEAYKKGGLNSVVEQLHQMGMSQLALGLRQQQVALKREIIGNKKSLHELNDKEFDLAMKKMSAFGNAASVIESVPEGQRPQVYQELKPQIEKMFKMELPDEYNQMLSLTALTTVMDIKDQISQNPYLLARLQPAPQAQNQQSGGYMPTFGDKNQISPKQEVSTQIRNLHDPSALSAQQHAQDMEKIAMQGNLNSRNMLLRGAMEPGKPSNLALELDKEEAKTLPELQKSMDVAQDIKSRTARIQSLLTNVPTNVLGPLNKFIDIAKRTPSAQPLLAEFSGITLIAKDLLGLKGGTQGFTEGERQFVQMAAGATPEFYSKSINEIMNTWSGIADKIHKRDWEKASYLMKNTDRYKDWEQLYPNPQEPSAINQQETSLSDAIRIKLPDGRIGMIPKNNLQKALSMGAKAL